jgi:hypothetical protein
MTATLPSLLLECNRNSYCIPIGAGILSFSMKNVMTIPKTIDITRHRLSRREFLKHTSAAGIGLTVSAVDGAEPSAAAPSPLSAVDRFNYVVGTQTIGASYQFTKQPRLIETAEAIREMGSSVIKIAMEGAGRETFQSLREIAANHQIIKPILAMPFAYYRPQCWRGEQVRCARGGIAGPDESCAADFQNCGRGVARGAAGREIAGIGRGRGECNFFRGVGDTAGCRGAASLRIKCWWRRHWLRLWWSWLLGQESVQARA